jgi:glutamate-1-semialdehyde 2,1-aminomutase
MNDNRSQELFKESNSYIPGGVNSPVRAFKAVGGTPHFMVKGKGSKLYDVDDNQFIDYVCSWGPLILGHAHPGITKALKKVLALGTSFGAPTELETILAKLVTNAMPSIEMIRFVNSGTEAVMTAIRLARAFTGRDKIVKFDGCYHGHADNMLVNAGSGLATMNIAQSPGIPASCVQNTLVAPYNDSKAVEQYFQEFPKDIAAIIVEPVAANMGVVHPQQGFLSNLRRISSDFKALLIFDEVITGFRVDYGGAQALFNINPDITCLGKIIGGGLPVGAYGGRRDIMSMVSPSGSVYQAGTLSGNPLVMTAGIETLQILSDKEIYKQLENKAAKFQSQILAAASKANITINVSRLASLMTIFFTGEPLIINYESARKSDTHRFGDFFNYLLSKGINWPPSQFEAAFLSSSHTDKDINYTVQTISEAFSGMVK